VWIASRGLRFKQEVRGWVSDVWGGWRISVDGRAFDETKQDMERHVACIYVVYDTSSYGHVVTTIDALTYLATSRLPSVPNLWYT